MSEQKFRHGDLVRITKDLGRHMRHFTGDCDAIVVGSYRDQFGGSNTSSYTLHLKGRGTSSWYDERQLTLIESGCGAMLDQWQRELEEEHAQQANLDWIFANGAAILEGCPGASAQALADCLGFGSLWGSRGEGIAFYGNSLAVLRQAAPYLETGDKDGWLSYCASLKNTAQQVKP